MSTFKGKKVLITGGASGIGKLMGGMALDKGAAALVIWDINQASIEQVVSELGQAAKAQGRAGRVYGMRVDVSNQAMVADRYEQTKREVGEIDILI
ncbi:MAG: SDR family NAD(P)-dependent oxidoreductase, partial [Bacteroidaceae bacterium]|nr:SDR family NAD(P)-dependent oxidoreductase [Bacteroidaceae bacterium]